MTKISNIHETFQGSHSINQHIDYQFFKSLFIKIFTFKLKIGKMNIENSY